MLDDQSVGFISATSDLAGFDFDWLRNVLMAPRKWDLRIFFLGGVLETKSKGDVGEVGDVSGVHLVGGVG